MASTKNQIVAFVHCRQCLLELTGGTYEQDVELGFTEDGRFQVWCRRHDRQVALLDVGRTRQVSSRLKLVEPIIMTPDEDEEHD